MKRGQESFVEDTPSAESTLIWLRDCPQQMTPDPFAI